MTATRPITATTFGEMLRHLRKRMQMTQQELGIALGYSTAMIARLENGERHPDLALVKTTYIEALGLEHEPELAAQLIALAAAARDMRTTASSARMNNLPTQLTRFIGRQREVAEVKRLVGAHRLVTLSGAGGVGKTRLAQQAGQELLGNYADGVWLVQFAPVMDASLVLTTCVASLNLSEQPNRTLLEILLTYLQEKAALLIFDNCEHLISACAELAEALLRGCPGVHILATSREPLGVPGEVVWRVPSLQTPNPDRLPSLAQVHEYSAIELFVSLGSEARTDFRLIEDNMTAVAQICHRLDGIPLAIEMAAAQVGVLSEHEIAAGLANGIGLLTAGSRMALPRHRTLRATLDWSYSLLSEPERILLARLSVFAGGWTAEAAREVCADDPLATPDVLPALLQLARKSLVVATMHNHHTRYHLLETIRQYAAEKLCERGETNPVRERHLLHYLALLEETMDLSGNRCWEWLSRVEPEHNNVRAAFNWARERADTDAGEMMLRVAASMRPFRHNRSYFEEGIAWLEEARERGAGAPAHARAKALLAQATIYAERQEKRSASISMGEDALTLFNKCGDSVGSAWSMELCMSVGDSQDPRYEQYIEQALAIFRGEDCQPGIIRCLMRLCANAYYNHQPTSALAYLNEALQIAQRTDDFECARTLLEIYYVLDPGLAIERCNREVDVLRQRGVGIPTAKLLILAGEMLLDQNEYVRATPLFEECISLLSQISTSPGDYHAQFNFAYSCLHLGQIAYVRGDLEQSMTWLARSLKHGRASGYAAVVALAQCLWGTLIMLQGQDREAEEELRQSLRYFHENGAIARVTLPLRAISSLARVKGRWLRSARLMGAYDMLLQPVYTNFVYMNEYIPFMEAVERNLADTRAQLGDAAYEAEYAIGQAMTVDEAVAYALES